ncbi:MAG TPA: class I SAM-dependent methyltransferase [Rhodanobacteraceae bacterium]
MTATDANIERFNTLADQWDDDPIRVLTGQKVARAIRNALAPQGTERALELGAGTGLLTMILASRVATLTALDSSAAMLDVLRGKLAQRGTDNVTVVEGAIPADVPAGPFDLVYSSMTLHHIADVPAALKAIAARLAPGGRVALADLDTEDGSFHGDAAGVAHHGFDRDTFAQWLRGAGLEEVSLSTAFVTRHTAADGSTREYPLFLAVARKPQA